MEIAKLYQKFKECSSVSTDTRNLQKNAMFFALKGDNFDGNKFVDKAIDNGAKYCVIDDREASDNPHCILVQDALKALQQLATYHRRAIGISIIGLTGSNGKTTTKELIHAVLKTTYKVQATSGNLNNHIGVPLTLLGFTEKLDFGIVEMGANHQKEIEFLSGICQPDYALITNFGKAHLEGFGGIEGVIKGKSELYTYVKSQNKTAFVNGDDPKQVELMKGYQKTVTFGGSASNDMVINMVDTNPFVKVKFLNRSIKSQLIGAYNFSNIATAIAIGHHFNVSFDHIAEAIENYIPQNKRSEIKTIGTNTVILDAYNANPTSMSAALGNFLDFKGKNKYLFLGDMFELGQAAREEHQAVADWVQKHFSNHIYLIGEHFYSCSVEPHVKKIKSFKKLIPELNKLNIDNGTVFIKGSRGMALERILDHL
jgi:UDP-N-acetylmuramoyl-tripeptide--D-alanyl-D-alanine ligase